MRSPNRTLVTLVVAILVAGCQEAPETASVSEPDLPPPVEAGHAEPAAAPAGPLPLREIMANLERDLAEVAHGFWVEDDSTIAAAARRVADHPHVSPQQMATIQATLGSEFQAFAEMDGRVHDASVALAEAAADTAASTAALYPLFDEVQQGCVSCHAAFRARVSAALASAGATP